MGGVKAKPGQIPYIASIRLANGDHFCGASIIRPRWVLSTAHCTRNFANTEITVVVGTHLRSNDGVRHQSSLIINHPEYNSPPMANDISLVQVAIPFTYTEFVQPIGIGSAVVGGHVTANVSGWGLTWVSYNNLRNIQSPIT